MKDSLATPEDAIAAARGEGDPAMLDRLVAVVPGGAVGLIDAAEAYVAYQGRLREGNAADFGDLLLWPTLAMERSAVLRRRWASRFDIVLADEYQDMNNAQYRFLTLLGQDHRQILVVGDDDQSIYRRSEEHTSELQSLMRIS